MQNDFSQKVPVALENLLNWASSNPRSGRVGPWVGLLDFHFSVEIQRKAEKGTKILWLSSKILRDSLSFSEILRDFTDFLGLEAQVLMGVKFYSEKDSWIPYLLLLDKSACWTILVLPPLEAKFYPLWPSLKAFALGRKES